MLWIAIILVALAIACPQAGHAEPVSFNRDIRPIMSDTCFHCHGFDASTREAGMRLDLREAALGETEGGVVPIVPGSPQASAIIARIFDDEDPMPPESAHKPLTARQKELLKRWVAEGAVYEPHWAYAPLVRPALPAGREGVNPIDAFIEARLTAKGLALSPEAAPHVLERRLALDLTGLPPEVVLTAKGESSASVPQVDRLLASPHFGERMAVWWLDIARFADTVGFHGDQNQRIFPYRDYVIDAFNANKPFDQFTREQLAGDLLPDPTREQLVATGYNRLNMMTREGGAQPKEYLAKYGAERVRAVAAAWFGSTFGCAECHDHKFDPIKSRDFYELQAFFADMRQWGVYHDYGYTPEPELKGINNDSPFPPEIEVESPWAKKQLGLAEQALSQHVAAAAARLAGAPQTMAAQAAWEVGIATFLASHSDGWLELAAAEPPAPVEGKPAAKTGAPQFVLEVPQVPAVTAVGLEVLTAGIDAGKLTAIPGKSLAIAVGIQPAEGQPRPVPLRSGAATAKRPVHQSGAEVPGVDKEWRLPNPLPTDGRLRAAWLVDPITLREGERLVVTVEGAGDVPVKVTVSPLAAVDPLDAASVDDVAALLVPASARSPAQVIRATTVFLMATAYDRAAFDETRRLADRVRGLFGGRAWTMVTQAVATPLPIRVLPRGNWQDESGPVVMPATPSFLPGRIESTDSKRLTRLDLANWLVSDANPLTARAVVNRLWVMFFGTGLSAAVDDLGSQGELPSNPELLDWLACEFRESGWDVKHIIRLIVTSRTYRQSSVFQPQSLAIDPSNRLLASQNPRRLEAEFVRDNALSIAALLNLADIGGPSVKPYQPADYYESLQFPNRTYTADTDPRQWRRGVYTHWQRTFLHPMMANFDAPARDECAAARTVSNTPQQALTLLNDPTFVEAARGFAARLLEDDSAHDDAARLRLAYRMALNREPRDNEAASLATFLVQMRETFKASPGDADKSLATGLSPRPALDSIELAAWTQVARVLLNTQEVITRY